MEIGRVFCLGHISVDIFVNQKDLKDLKVGGCISSPNLSIQGGGVAANVSFWLGILGTNVSMIGVIANDPAGHFLKKDLERVNVNCYLKISTTNPSSSILTVVEEDGERSFIINGKCLDELVIEDIPFEDIEDGSLFYTSAYNIENPPINQTIEEILKRSKNENFPNFEVMFNLAAYTTVEKHRVKLKQKILPYTDILIGNLDEYQILLNQPFADLAPSKLLEELNSAFPTIHTLLLTDGENGCHYKSKFGDGHIPAVKVSVVDSTGAGDGFTAGFINGYVKNLPIERAIKAGAKLGSNICQGFGARFSSDDYKFESI